MIIEVIKVTEHKSVYKNQFPFYTLTKTNCENQEHG